MKKIKILFAFLLIVVLSTGSLFASGGARNGTAGATQLLIPVGARGVAMSGSAMVNLDGIEGMYYNPALLSRSTHQTQATFSLMNYIADIDVQYGAVSFNVEGLGTFGFSFKSLNVDDIEVTTVQNPEGTGQFFSPGFNVIGLTYSKMLSDRISVGITANLINEELALVSASGIGFDVGITYSNLANIQGFGFGIAIKNLGPQMAYEGSGLNIDADAGGLRRQGQIFYKIEAASFELPSTLEIGLGYQLSIDQQNSLNLNGTFQNSNFYGDEYRIGGEYNFDNTFFVRGGYMMTPDLEEDENIYGLTAGVGLNYDLGNLDLKVNYAFREVEFFDNNHVFSVGFGF